MTVIRRARALLDVEEISDHIAQSSRRSAFRFLNAFDETLASLAPMPTMGSPHESDHPRLQGVRVWPVRGFRNYLIYYREIPDGIEVLRVLYGGRDIDPALEGNT
jgi:toxin ParE1/3/4